MNPDIHTLTGAYALDALSAEEAAEFERHTATCADCGLEVDELRDTATRLGAAAAEAPPTQLRAAVLQAITNTRQQPPVLSLQAKRQRRMPTANRFLALAATAAAVVLAVLTAVQTIRLYDTQSTAAQVGDRSGAVARLLAAPDARVSTVHAGSASATVVSTQRGRSLVLITDGMSPLPAGRTYQAWTMGTDGAHSAGLITDPAHPSIITAALTDGTTQVGITDEPAGGSAEPSTGALMVIPTV